MAKSKNKDHKRELRKREILESFCVEPGCKFNGKHAAQGICHTRHSRNTHEYVDRTLARGQELLDEMKSLRKMNKQTSSAAWIKRLEGHLVCQWANEWFTLDALIHLRAENAKLRVELGKWGKK
jgi:hypothetical protein